MNLNKKYLSNITTGILIGFVASLFLFPAFKGKVMQGLMKVGLFQPDIPNLSKEQSTGDLSASQEEANVSFKNPKGEVVQLSSLKGQVVFINFWATWCPPCIAEMPTIQTLYSEFKDHKEAVFMMVDVDDKREKSQDFMDKRKFDLPIYTPVSSIPSSYLGGAIPTTIVLNKQGKIVFKHEGMGDFSNEEFRTFINQLIAE